MNNQNITFRAYLFAKDAHEFVDQKRKYTGDDYIVHPIEVANIVKSWSGDTQQIAAAYLHDTVEDTWVTLDEIKTEFGDDIATLVNGLTNVSKRTDGNRATRKQIDLNHFASQDARTQLVKLADIKSNLNGIVDNDPKFAKTYLKEQRALILALNKVSDHIQKDVLGDLEIQELKLSRLFR